MKAYCKSCVILLTAQLLVAGQALAAPTLEFAPATQTVTLGAQATVDVNVTGLSNEFVGAFDFDVTWDDSLLSLAGVAFGTSLGGPLDSIQSDPINDPFNPTVGLTGIANLLELSLLFDLSGVQNGNDPFTLFSLTFDTLDTGTSSLGFAPGLFGVFLGDEFGLPLLTDANNTGAITIERLVVVVPAPGVLALMFIGLASLGWSSRRRWI